MARIERGDSEKFPPRPAWAWELWHEDGPVRSRLSELWNEYIGVGERWKREREVPVRRSAREQRKLWKAMEPFHASLPPLSLFYVDYPEPVLHVVPPGSIILGDADGRLDWEKYANSLVKGANRLTSVSTQ